jgi:hypothetical protein
MLRGIAHAHGKQPLSLAATAILLLLLRSHGLHNVTQPKGDIRQFRQSGDGDSGQPGLEF